MTARPLEISRDRARVLVVGVGGLVSPVALALVHAGVGTLGLVDDDDVELSNLHRQILYGAADVGAKKTLAAEAALARIPRIMPLRIERHDTRLSPENAASLVARYDLVVEGSDNFATKFLASDACVLAGISIVHAAAVRWHGTVLAVSARGRPCYRCLFEDLPDSGREGDGDAPNCAEAGVMGPVVGIVGAVQADLALAMLDGCDVGGTLVTFDGMKDTARRRRISPRSGCVSCGSGREAVLGVASREVRDSGYG
jgi:molybdopterin/thiamine biosynthesis adenylyltransferase